MNTFEIAKKELNIDSLLLLMYIQLEHFDLIGRLFDGEKLLIRLKELKDAGYVDEFGIVRKPLEFEWGGTSHE